MTGKHERRRDVSPPGAETRNLYLALGGLLLLVGFGAGYLVGIESARVPGVPRTPMTRAEVAHSEAGHDHASEAGSGHGATRGHTFTGQIDAPPHGEVGHGLAKQALAKVPCPCGGCEGMTIAGCTCDMAREVAAVAAHLLERGEAGDAVLRQLEGHYRLDLQPEALALAARVSLEGSHPAGGNSGGAGVPAGVPSDVADFVERAAGANDGVTRPRDVPTSARP